MVRWCDRCECVEASHRVEYSESSGHFSSFRWVQRLCDDCKTEKVLMVLGATLTGSGSVWGLEVHSL